MNEAEYFYERASKNNFAIADYNLACFFEQDGNYEKSIKYFIKASYDESHKFSFRNVDYKDIRLEISQTFVICLTNLILVKHYLKFSDLNKAKIYFNKTFSKINNASYQFQFKFSFDNDSKNVFTYLKDFILNQPQFNLMNQLNLNEKIKSNIYDDFNKNQSTINHNKLKNRIKYDETIDDELIFDEPLKLFDFIIKYPKLIDVLRDDIKEIINLMKLIIYTPPYDILFGRISILKPKSKQRYINSNQEKY